MKHFVLVQWIIILAIIIHCNWFFPTLGFWCKITRRGKMKCYAMEMRKHWVDVVLIGVVELKFTYIYIILQQNKDEDRSNIIPSAASFEAPRERIEDSKPAMSGVKTFLYMMFVAIVIIVIVVLGIMWYQKKQEHSRKRLYWWMFSSSRAKNTNAFSSKTFRINTIHFFKFIFMFLNAFHT